MAFAPMLLSLREFSIPAMINFENISNFAEPSGSAQLNCLAHGLRADAQGMTGDARP
jgi:hypothetical protein